MVLPLKYVPWRRVRAWRCLACGECCRRFDVPLRAREFVEVTGAFGGGVAGLKHGKPYLRKPRGKCVFQAGRRCSLHSLGMKPHACKIYPFTVRAMVKRGGRSARFPYMGRNYYVYANPGCRGLILGTPGRQLVQEIIPEAIELSLNPEKEQRRLTSSLLNTYPPVLIPAVVGLY